MIGGIVLGAYQKASSVSTVPEPKESGRFENCGFAGSSNLFSFRMITRVSSVFQMKQNASGTHQS